MTPRPTPDTELLFLGLEGVLFSQPRQELHRFNTTAAIIWCHLANGLDAAEIAEALAADSDLPAATAAGYVAAALADWRDKHLLDDGMAIHPITPEPAAAPSQPLRPDRDFAVQHSFALLDTVMRVRFATAAQAAMVAPILDHLRSDRLASVTLDIFAVDDHIVISRDGSEISRCDGLDALAPEVKHAVWGTALRQRDDLLEFHAGVVAGVAGCVLLPAVAGSGKSTLTAAMVQAGFIYYSDEVALLQAADFSIRPFPLALCVKDSGLAVAATLFPEIAALPLHNRADGKRVVYIPPPSESLPAADARAQVCGLVFPRYQAGSATIWQPLSAADALQRLLDQCLVVAQPLTLPTMRRLVAWIDGRPAAQLTYANLAEAVAAVAALLHGPTLGRAG